MPDTVPSAFLPLLRLPLRVRMMPAGGAVEGVLKGTAEATPGARGAWPVLGGWCGWSS